MYRNPGNNILVAKYKFFLNRMIGYFSFFLIPLWLQKVVGVNAVLQIGLGMVYMCFMASQWYLLGKELDHRLKIYYRTNSSIDRILYRAITGCVIMLIYFNFLTLLPADIIKHFFWGTFAVLGLFYSWPTRGKIIQEGISNQFSEYRFLDSFEKTVLFLMLLMFIVSIPEAPHFQSVEAFKLYFDPQEQIHNFYWRFVEVNYLPLKKAAKLYFLSWHTHFYFYGVGLFLMSFYSLLRYFFSRRLSILGVFSLVSSWSLTKFLDVSPIDGFVSTFPLVCCWAALWLTKSATYRTGLFLGIMTCYGVLISPMYILVSPLILLILFLFERKTKTKWYLKQFSKYSLYGSTIAVILSLLSNKYMWKFRLTSPLKYFDNMANYLDDKAFYTLFLLGIVFLFLRKLPILKKKLTELKIEDDRVGLVILLYLTFLIFGLFFEPNFTLALSGMWILAFLSLVPLEWIFQTMSRMRSRRNLIYVIYVLVCLLDSHFEGRVKTFLTFLKY